MTPFTGILLAWLLSADAPLPYSHRVEARALKSEYSLTVRVLDQAQQPVPGVDVKYAYRSQPFSVAGTLPKTVTTDADGRCSFTGLKPGDHNVFVQRGDAGALAQTYIGPDNPTAQLDLPLGAYFQIAGYLIDEEAHPIAGARVFANNAFEVGQTDPNGRFVVPHLVEEEALISFQKDDYATTQQHMRPWNEVTIGMPRGVPLRVAVLGVPPQAPLEISVSSLDNSRHFLSGVPWTGGPSSGVVWVPADSNMSITATCEFEDRYYRGSTTVESHSESVEAVVTVAAEYEIRVQEGTAPDGDIIRTYYPVGWTGEASIAGRVRNAANHAPVQATIACRLTKNHVLYARTQDDGTFAFGSLPRKAVTLTVDADDPTLFDRDGYRRLDTSRQSRIAGFDIDLEQGTAISGTVTSIPKDIHPRVVLRPSVYDYFDPIRVKLDGSFVFEHVPPGEYVVALRTSYQPPDFEVTPLGTLERGTIRKVVLNAATLAGHGITPGKSVTGAIVDREGRPVAGARVSLRRDFPQITGTTALDGSFRMPYLTSGDTFLTVSRSMLYLFFGESETVKQDMIVVDGNPIAFPEDGEVGPIRLVVEEGPTPGVVGGRIVSPTSPSKRDIDMRWYALNGMGTMSTTNGRFIIGRLPQGQTALEFVAKGHQARILLEGRDYNRGDLNVRVELKPLPYSNELSVFEQVAGVDLVQLSEFPVLKRIAESSAYRYEGTRSRDSVLAAPRITIQDNDEKPIQRIYLLRWAKDLAGLPDTRLEEKLYATTIEDSAGRYKRPVPYVWIWADGCARFWYAREHEEGTGTINTLTLQPESTLRIRITGKNTSKPIEGCSVLLAPNVVVPGLLIWPAVFTQYSGPGAITPVTDSAGEVVFRNLGAGTYTCRIAFPDQTKLEERIEIGVAQHVERTFEY